MIPSQTILLQSRKAQIDGKQTYNAPKHKLSEAQMKKIEDEEQNNNTSNTYTY